MLALGFSANFSENLTAENGTTRGSESGHARSVLEDTFGLGESEQDLIVFQSTDLTVDDPAYGEAVEAAIAALAKRPAVTDVGSPLADQNRAQISGDDADDSALAGGPWTRHGSRARCGLVVRLGHPKWALGHRVGERQTRRK